MSKYIIRMESVDNDAEFKNYFGEGIQCDGFCIIAKQDGGNNVSIHKMSIDMISDAIANSDNLLSAAILGKAKRDIKEMDKYKAKSAISELLKALT